MFFIDFFMNRNKFWKRGKSSREISFFINTANVTFSSFFAKLNAFESYYLSEKESNCVKIKRNRLTDYLPSSTFFIGLFIKTNFRKEINPYAELCSLSTPLSNITFNFSFRQAECI